MSSDFLNHPEYISLKEASELSGYHADHVGRLIRRGLLYGKRTPRGWVTTRTALTHYARGKVELAKLSPILASADFDTSGALAPEPSRGMELRGAQQAIGVVAPKENTGVAVQSLSEVRHVKTGTSLFSRIALLIGAPVVGVGLALGIIVILGQSSVADGIGAFANRVLDAFDGVPAAQPVADGNGSALEKIAQTLEELGANVEQLATREPETIVQEVSRTTNEVTQQVTNVTQENVVRDVTDGQIATAVEKLLLEGIVVPGTSDFSGANVDRLSVEDNLAVSGTISAPTFKGGGLIVDHAELSGNLTVEGITDFNGSVTLGDTLSTITIASSTWNVTAAGAASGFTELTVDNLKMDGNTLSSLTSGGVTISPLAGESVSVALSTTGNFVVNTDDLVVDTDTGNVGIGLTAPGEELTLASTYSLGWDNGAGTADVTLYRSAANTLKTDDLFVVNNDLSVTGDLEVLGITTTAGNVDLGDTVVDTITFIGVVDSNIIPVSSSAYDLGSASLRWDNGYFDSITANTLTGVVVGGATSAEDWTINSDNATPNEELSTLSFETGTGSFNAVMQWNASGDAGRVSGFDNTLLFNYPIAFYSQVSGPNQTFTSGTLFSYSQPLAHAITQSGAFTGINVDFSSNITNTTGNQTGIAITLKDGSVSGTTTGLTLSGTADYGIDLTSATIGTAAITLPVGTAAAQGITFGADTNLYRSAADTLKTDDSLVVGGSLTISAGSTVLTSSSTTADNKTLSVSQTGATVGTDYAGYFANTGAATTNVGLYATATGATNNYAAIFEAGSVGIGTTTPDQLLTIDDGSLGFSTGGGASDVVLSRGAADRLDLASGDSLNIVSGNLNFTSGNVLLTSNAVGVLRATNIETDATNKSFKLGVMHYTNATSSMGLLYGISQAASNTVYIGGGTGSFTAATNIGFWTAANNSTTTGTQVATLDGNGQFAVTTTGSSAGILIGGDTQLYRSAAGTLLFTNGSTGNTFSTSIGGTGTNYIQAVSASNGGGAVLRAIGTTDANVNVYAQPKGTGGFVVSDQSANPWFVVNGLASAANYITVTPTVTLGSPSINAVGTDTNVSLQLFAKGTGGVINLGNNGGTTLATLNASGQFQIPTVGSSAGLLIGGDAQLYRSAADTLALASGDSLYLVSGGIGLGVSTPGTGNFESYNIAATASVSMTSTSGGTARLLLGDADVSGAYDVRYSGSGNQFAIRTTNSDGIGTDANVLEINDAGLQVAFPGTGSSAGLLIGGDTQLYRSAADTLALASGDSLTLVSGTITGYGASTSTTGLQLAVVGDANARLLANSNGTLRWGDGTSAQDTILFRGAADRLDLASGDSFNIVSGGLTVGGTGTADIEGYASIGNGSALDSDNTLIVDGTVNTTTAAGRSLYVRGTTTVDLAGGYGLGAQIAPRGITVSGVTATAVASLWVSEPVITLSTGAVTTASTLYIENAPTEGGSNYALFVDSGATQLDGNLRVDGTVGLSGAPSANVTLQTARVFTAAAANVGMTMQLGDAITGAANTNIYGLNVTNDFTVPIGATSLVAQGRFVGRTITATGTLTNAATLYVSDAMAGASNNYALWVDSGNTRLDGQLLFPSNGGALASSANGLRSDISNLMIQATGSIIMTADADNSSSDNFQWWADAAEYGGTSLATLTSAGQYQLPVTGSSAGLLVGGDTQLYRSAANTLTLGSGDVLTTAVDNQSAVTLGTSAGSGSVGLTMATGAKSYFWNIPGTSHTAANLLQLVAGTYSAGVAASPIITIEGDAGRVNFPTTGSGAGITIGGDANLYRSAANVLKTDDAFTTSAILTVTSGGADITGGLTLSGVNNVATAIAQDFKQVGTTGKFNFRVGSQTNVDNGFEITPSTAADGSTFSTPALVVTSGGFVGIGKTAPASRLDVRHATTGTGDLITLGNVTNGSSGAIGTDATLNLVVRSGSGNNMVFQTNGTTERLRLDTAGGVFINDSANTLSTIGLTINQGANDNEILALKSSDVAGAWTSVAEADTYGYLSKVAANEGGLMIHGLAESNDEKALLLKGTIDFAAVETTKSSAGSGVIVLNAALEALNTDAAVGADGNLVSIENNGTTTHIFDADGDTWQSGTSTLGGNLIFSTALDIVAPSNTSSAFDITDGTTSYYKLDTRTTVSGIMANLFNSPARTVPDGATSTTVLFRTQSGNITYTGPTQITELQELNVFAGNTLLATNPLTIDKATTVRAVAPVESTNLTLTDASAIRILNTSGTPTNQYGLYIEDMTTGGSDYGIAISGADTAALWISSAADTTDAANGIAFGLSRDTNLYRSAANTLKTDDALLVANLTSSGTAWFGTEDSGRGTVISYGQGTGQQLGGRYQVQFSADYDTTTNSIDLTAFEDDLLIEKSNGTDLALFTNEGSLFLNDTANSLMTLGLTINQGANDNEIVTLKSSDVAHGLTAMSETDSFGRASKYHATNGGLSISGLSGANVGLNLRGLTATTDTTKSTSGVAAIMLTAGANNAALAANSNLVAIENYGSRVWIADADGDTWQNGTLSVAGTGDSYIMGELGIGTTSPGTPLDVTKAGGGNYVAHFQNTTAATPYTVSIKAPAAAVGGYPLINITDSAGTSQFLRVDSTGGVGIGVSPSLARGINLVQAGAKTAADYGQVISNTSTSSTASINKYGLYVSSTGTWDGASAVNYGLYVDTPSGGTANYAASFAGGNVGIGTATPQELLNVNGEVSIGAAQAGQANVNLHVFGDNAKAGSAETVAFFGSSDATNPLGVAIGHGGSSDYGNIQATTIGLAAKNLILNGAGGNVGIGTTSPGGLGAGGSPTILHLSDSGATANDFALLNLSSANVGSGGTIGSLEFGTTGTVAAEKRGAMILSTLTAASGTNVSGNLVFYTNNAGSITEKLQITSAGQIQAPVTGSSAGISIGGDTQLYRSAADILKTDDSFVAATKLAVGQSALTDNTVVKIAGSTSTAGSGGGILGVYGGTVTATANGDNTNVIYTSTTIAKAGFTGLNAYGIWIDANAESGTGTIANAYGLNVVAQTIGTNNYGVKIDVASTQTLWVNGSTDSTTAAGGIAFGSSRDTQLYRGAADRLDLASGDSLNIVNGTLSISSASSPRDLLTLQTAKFVYQGAGDTISLQGVSDPTVAILRFGSGTTTNISAHSGVNTYFNSGNDVGIGTAAPESRLQITGGGLCVGSDANCNSDNDTEGVVYSSSTSMTTYDVAENYPTKDATITPGEIVSIDEVSGGPFVKRAEQGETILGAISTQPGVLLGGFNGAQYREERQVAVALSGRIDIAVSAENGAIKAGDAITLSSTPGVGMKAVEDGRIVGIALESLDSEAGTILVFVNPGWWSPTAGGLAILEGSSSTEAQAVIQTVTTSVEGLVTATIDGMRTFIFDGAIKARGAFAGLFNVSPERIGSFATSFISSLVNGGNEIVADSSKLRQEASADGTGAVQITTYSIQSSQQEILISGTGMLRACADYAAGGASGCNEVANNLGFTMNVGASDVVGIIAFAPEFSSLLDSSAEVRVLITPTDQVGGTVYVSGKSARGFVVAESNAQDAGSTFDWIVIARIGTGTGAAQLEQVFIENSVIDQQVSNPPAAPTTEVAPSADGQPSTTTADAPIDSPQTTEPVTDSGTTSQQPVGDGTAIDTTTSTSEPSAPTGSTDSTAPSADSSTSPDNTTTP